MWFEAPESTNHMSSGLRALVKVEAHIEFSLCLITNFLYVFIVAVGQVVRELSACGSRFTLLLSALFFVVTGFSAISAFGGVLAAQTGMEAPPSSEGSTMASFLRPKLFS